MEKVLIIDFGGQYNQLIARRVREAHVYCEVRSYKDLTMDAIRAFAPQGIIFTGGPQSVYLENSPSVDPEVFRMGVPVLGICYGCQLMAHLLGGQVTEAQEDSAREYGKTVTYFDTDLPLFQNTARKSITWMSHGDYMAKVPEGSGSWPTAMPAPMWPLPMWSGGSTASSSIPRSTTANTVRKCFGTSCIISAASTGNGPWVISAGVR